METVRSSLKGGSYSTWATKFFAVSEGHSRENVLAGSSSGLVLKPSPHPSLPNMLPRSPLTPAKPKPAKPKASSAKQSLEGARDKEPTDDDLDETNMRLFFKSTKHVTAAFVHRIMRLRGPVLMVVVQGKRRTVLVEYETKDAAVAAKSSEEVTKSLSGETYAPRSYWGKRLEREPPVKNPIPDWDEMVRRCHLTHVQMHRRLAQAQTEAFTESLLMLLAPNPNAALPLEPVIEQSSVPVADAPGPLPPGIIHPSAMKSNTTPLDNAPQDLDILSQPTVDQKVFEICARVDPANVGDYPLRCSDPWFAPGATSSFARISQPVIPSYPVDAWFALRSDTDNDPWNHFLPSPSSAKTASNDNLAALATNWGSIYARDVICPSSDPVFAATAFAPPFTFCYQRSPLPKLIMDCNDHAPKWQIVATFATISPIPVPPPSIPAPSFGLGDDINFECDSSPPNESLSFVVPPTTTFASIAAEYPLEIPVDF